MQRMLKFGPWMRRKPCRQLGTSLVNSLFSWYTIFCYYLLHGIKLTIRKLVLGCDYFIVLFLCFTFRTSMLKGETLDPYWFGMMHKVEEWPTCCCEYINFRVIRVIGITCLSFKRSLLKWKSLKHGNISTWVKWKSLMFFMLLGLKENH